MATVVQLRPAIGQLIYRDMMTAGLRIFSLYRFRTNGVCECGDAECLAAGKHPRATSWQHTPEWDEEQIQIMEEHGHFDSGYGVLCRGHIIIDVDARNGGVESYKKLKKLIPAVDDAGLTVNTGSGGGSQHLYFSAPDDVSLVTHLPEYPGIDFKSSGYVVGPGSAHKSGGVYTADGYPEDIGPAPDALIELLKRPERHRSEFNGHAVDLAHSDIADMLSHIPNNDVPYEEWISIGMSIHHATQGSGFELWNAWSATSGKHDSKQMEYKWGSFGRSANPVTLGTLIHHAESGGWTMPVTFVPDQQFNEEVQVDGLPFDISGVDLTAPPGFVGDVARWMDACSSRPRKHIAVAAALTTIGNIGGLRYVDDLSGVTANLFTFCVAGAGTGKGAIQKASAALMREAGIAAASHGGIKSEQEMIRNLIRHQASFYSIDEVGIFLGKIDNAKKKGGAAYLEGIPGMMMSAYSLADDWMGISGDLKDDTRKALVAELSQIEKMLDNGSGENPFIESRKASRERFLRTLDNGIERPFVSMMGFTTPSTFGETVSASNVANGFIRRCLIFNERETVPRTRGVWQKPIVSLDMANYVRAIWSGGEYDSQSYERVENYDEPTKVPTAADARGLLDRCKDWFEETAEDAKSASGLESLFIGAYELVSKVSLILAIPEQLRTVEHVRWAFALVKRDIEDKVNLVTANDKLKSSPKKALRAALLALIGDTPFKEGAIFNRLDDKFKREDIVAELQSLAKVGVIEISEKQHPRNKTVFRTYSMPDSG